MPMHPSMSNVDAVRTLADEHHLEFVDLDRFNVDASVSSVIPVAVARRHHVVPIGRKFGAPVVAMSNPGDVMAMDVLRAVIGREFVAVVAIDEQIDTTLARVYGGGDSSEARRVVAAPSAGGRQHTASNSHARQVAEVHVPPAPTAAAPPAPPRLEGNRRPRHRRRLLMPAAPTSVPMTPLTAAPAVKETGLG